MNQELRKIIELAKIDIEIDSFGPKEESLKSELNKLVEKSNGIKAKIEELEGEAKECKFKSNKHDAHLKELSSKLADISKKSSTIKTEREIKALQIEEEIAREQVAFANEEIARLDTVEHAKKDEAKKLEESLVEIAEQIKSFEVSLSGDLKDLEESKKVVYAKKDKLVFEINPKVYSFYQKIKRWAGASTVVPVVGKACSGCNIQITDNDYRKVIRSEEIMTCSNCGRILYLDETEIENG